MSVGATWGKLAAWLPWEPESLDMKTIVLMGILVCSNFWAVRVGPMQLVCR